MRLEWLGRGTCTASVALALAGTACATQAGGINVVRPEVPAARDSIAITVINDHWYDARVYAVYGGAMRYPLGVIGNKREVGPIVIPWQIQELSMEVDLIIAPGRYVTDEILVQPGDIVELRIPPNISSSGFFRPMP